MPAAAPLVLPASFPPGCTIEIQSSEGGRTLAAAIELVGPGYKDRAGKRRLFAAKCAPYLMRGVGLVIVDVITTRKGNLHNDLAKLMGLDGSLHTTSESLYTVAYRPLRDGQSDQIEAWPTALRLGHPLPEVPLSLGADLCVRVDLESAYQDACRRRKVAEVLG